MTIYKYTLELQAFQHLEIPHGATFLHVAMQHGQLCVWARVDTAAAPDLRRFAVVGTGQACPDDEEGQYLGTALDGDFVWHVFVKR